MKGLTNMTFVIASSLLVTIGGLSLVLSYQSHSVIKGAQERAVVESINQMKFIEMGIEQAALYSAYQGVYPTSKYGTYKDGSYGISGTCDSTLIDPVFPKNDLPYWRIFGDTCFSTKPPEIEDIIKTQLNLEASDIFNKGYIETIKKEYDIIIPVYTSDVKLVDAEKVSLDFSASGEIKFESETLKLSDKLDKITKEIKLPLKRLIDYSINKFINPSDPFAEEIKKAEQAMSDVALNHAFVKPEYVNNNLNDGELKGNCKSTNFETCVDPRVIPDFTYNRPSKAELLPTNCQPEFETKIRKNMNGLEDELNTKAANTDVSLEPKNVKTNINLLLDETKCTPDKTPNFGNCDCIRWVCQAPNQVKAGDQERERPIGDFVVGDGAGKPNVECTTCFSAEGGNCIQYSDKVCFEGTPQNGFCKVEVNPSCNAGSYNGITNDCRTSAICSGLLNGATDMCEASPDCPIGGSYFSSEDVCVLIAKEEAGCPAGFTQVGLCFGGECTCHTSDTCSTGILDSGIDKCLSSPKCPIGTGYDAVNDNCVRAAFCSRGFLDTATDRCEDFVGKKCPLGTEEYQGTGRCYNTPSASSEPVCNLHKTLYTKICSYNYQAEVATLVNLKDTIKENKYPVYDSIEQKTDFKNLELQFYVLSKN